jgi:CDP-diacylglycerol--glycerol-3-phosphate 3-phosphatidyltransferase
VNTANKFTLVRIIMVPVFMLVLLSDLPYSNWVALAIFAVASATDAVDGYIARSRKQETDFGRFLDPLADKLLVTAAILIFTGWGQIRSWAAMIIIAREFAVTGLRLIAVTNGRVIAAAFSGKIKTVTSIVAICIMITPLASIEVIPGVITVNGVAVGCMLVTTVWSGAEYFIKNYDVIKSR